MPYMRTVVGGIEMSKNVQAKFCRVPSAAHIEISLPGFEEDILLWRGLISSSFDVIGSSDLEQVISILSRDKEAMLKRDNFPPVYDELLSELIDVQIARYGVKKEKRRQHGYAVSKGKLEEILGLYSHLNHVRISKIYIGNDKQDLDRLDFGSDDRELFIQFKDVGEEEEDGQ